MTQENLDIQLTGNNTLTIRGERKFEEIDKAKYHRVERFYGNFMRSFVLPSNVCAVLHHFFNHLPYFSR
jgi:HSP20 family protein